MTRIPKADTYLVTGQQTIIECKHCKERLELILLMSVKQITFIVTAFNREHQRCMKKAEKENKNATTV